MKKSEFFYPEMAVLLFIMSNQLHAQQERSDNFNVGVDLYSNYVWRGTKYGQGPAVQPSLKFNTGFFTAGIWGSFDAAGYMEADPYVSFALPLGFNLGLTDYYYPGMEFFDVSTETGSQALEANLGFTRGGLNLTANYIFNEAGGAASQGGDKYFQAGYSFGHFLIFLGAGDGWHTSDGKFAICNAGLGAGKEIKITESFSIPVSGQVIMNPEKQQLYVVVGFSF